MPALMGGFKVGPTLPDGGCILLFGISTLPGGGCVWFVPAVAGLGFVVLAPFPGWGCVFLFWVVPWSLTVPNGPNAIACAGVGITRGDATVYVVRHVASRPQSIRYRNTDRVLWRLFRWLLL